MGLSSHLPRFCNLTQDTFNLIGHALELVVDCAAQIKQVDESEVIKEAGTQLIGRSSIKAALDIDWSDPKRSELL